MSSNTHHPPSISRIRSHREFRRIYDSGIKISCSFFVIFFLREAKSDIRYGLTVTRKTGGAVIRNRIKRVLKEAVRQLAHELVPGISFVIIALPVISDKKTQEVCTMLRSCLRKRQLIHETFVTS